MNKEKFLRVALPIAAVVASVGVGFAGIASAQTASTNSGTTTHSGWMGKVHGNHPGAFGKDGHGMGAMGTVTGVNGTTVTIAGKDGTSYTVDGSSAKVSKMMAITVGDIKVGDQIGVRGSVSGTQITAQDIMDGIPQRLGQK